MNDIAKLLKHQHEKNAAIEESIGRIVNHSVDIFKTYNVDKQDVDKMWYYIEQLDDALNKKREV